MIEKDKLKKTVTICSWLLIALAVVDAVSFAVVCFQAAGYGFTMDVIIAMAAMSAVSTVVGILCKVFLSVKGFKEVKGTNKGTRYVVFAYVLFVLEVIAIALSLAGLFSGSSVNWLQFLPQLTAACVFFCFARFAKQLHGKQD